MLRGIGGYGDILSQISSLDCLAMELCNCDALTQQCFKMMTDCRTLTRETWYR